MKSTVFTQKAEDYALYRPQYSSEAIEALIDIVSLNSSWKVADIASGTGNVSINLVDKVKQVFAVEPEGAMRQQAEWLLNKHSSFKSIEATAENTTLEDKSIDLITLGQAFHWIDWTPALTEFNRILKPEGWIALLWNEYETTPEFEIEYIFKAGTQRRHSFSCYL